MPEFSTAGTIALYAATPDEQPTRSFFELLRSSGRRGALPRIRPERVLEFAIVEAWEDLRSGRYGLLEPGSKCKVVSVSALDLFFVPGLAFDVRGGRLGRGGGYYDRTLAAMAPGPRRPAVFGVAHDWQIAADVPMGSYDWRVDGVVTERRLLRAMEPSTGT